MFVFFGLVAVVGTTYVQTETFELPALYAGVGVGALACAILVANNLRDIPTDTVAGKRTLAVRARRSRDAAVCTRRWSASALACLALGAFGALDPSRWPTGGALGAAALVVAVRPLRTVRDGARGPALVPVLVATGQLVLVYGVLLSAGIAFSALWR